MDNLFFYILFVVLCSGCCGCSFTWGRKRGGEEAQARGAMRKAEGAQAAEGDE